ncbi:MAG: glycoside hydrolase family 3 protein [Oscillospiraceae bacterium]|nr:glycoside hydrolase family 3 protein [Oscillospiraceae bacterium]
MTAIRKARIPSLCVAALLTLALSAGCSDRAGKAIATPETASDSASDNIATSDSVAAPETAPDSASGESDSVRETDADESRETDVDSLVSRLLDAMSLEQKVAQMIMPSIRAWGQRNVRVLSESPALAEALRRHQYGGVILFSANISDTAQTVRLISDLQSNNAKSADAATAGVIPYLVAADQEGGSVARLTMGTRGTGGMAIGATGENAERNAFSTGRIFGEELSALGINVNLGPCVDVITDWTDSGMSTRIFSDDSRLAAKLGAAFMEGVGESGVITTFKHFPGAGDGSDYPTSIRLTRSQLDEGGLSAFREAIRRGAEMVMISATTFPLLDEETLMADGATKGYYPATLSPRIVTQILREELGFDGVVITDALEMDQFVVEPDNGKALFSGRSGGVTHDLQVAERAINVGCDILLLPADLNGESAAQYYDNYIAGIVGLVRDDAISAARIDEAARRVLTLKARHGLLDMDVSGADVAPKIEAAKQIVGSAAHHAVEAEIAAQAVTLLKDDGILPLSGKGSRVVILGRTKYDAAPIGYALRQLMDAGLIDEEARIENRISGEISGDKNAETSVIIDCYYATDNGGRLLYSDRLAAAIRNADAAVCLSAVGAGLDALQDDSLPIVGVSRALSDAHKAGTKFVLLSDNLPADAARFQDADAIVCAYLSAGFGVDPTARTSGSENVGAFNANVPAALRAIFGAADMPGTLPISIPVLEKGPDGAWAYGDEILYERGFSASK